VNSEGVHSKGCGKDKLFLHHLQCCNIREIFGLCDFRTQFRLLFAKTRKPTILQIRDTNIYFMNKRKIIIARCFLMSTKID
jgi:hypothetical protein